MVKSASTVWLDSSHHRTTQLNVALVVSDTTMAGIGYLGIRHLPGKCAYSRSMLAIEAAATYNMHLIYHA